MTYDQLANFISGDVADSVPTSSDSIEVVDAEEFADPSDGTYPLVIWDAAAHSLPSDDPNAEIVRVTDWDTEEDTLTVDRGMEGTEDVSHPATSGLIHGPTAETPIEALATAGDEGTVPVAQGDGTLAMADAGLKIESTETQFVTLNASGGWDFEDVEEFTLSLDWNEPFSGTPVVAAVEFGAGLDAHQGLAWAITGLGESGVDVSLANFGNDQIEFQVQCYGAGPQ